MKMYLPVGAAGSGKSTAATAMASGGSTGVVCRDTIRIQLNAHHGVAEGAVTTIEDASIRSFLRRGMNVYVDATNLRPKFIKGKVAIAREFGADVVFMPFDVELKELKKRNEEREESKRVPVDVLKRQYSTFRSNFSRGLYDMSNYPDASGFRKFEMDPSNPDTVLIDIDGTVALMDGRSPYDYSKVSTDIPNEEVVRLVRLLARKYQIVFMSGRKDECREDTERWLAKHVAVPYAGLYMRTEGDNRRDDVVKHELFVEHVEPVHNVRVVFDDRNQVVSMWRAAGLTCLQVADGDF